eukprot:1471158-Pleurochrysis_carterae.AAC.1
MEEKAAREAAEARRAEGQLKPLSPEGVNLLIHLKHSYEQRFNNRSDKVQAVWLNVHNDFIQAIDRGLLTEDDRREVPSLTA